MLFASLATGTFYTCGLTAGGAAYIAGWGVNADGELGDNTSTQRVTPTPVAGGLVFTSLAAGDSSTCGLTAVGAAYCWGLNVGGQLGDGTTTSRHAPVAVQGGLVFASSPANGNGSTCGDLTTKGRGVLLGTSTMMPASWATGPRRGASPPVAVQGGLVFTTLTYGFSVATAAA